MVNNVTIQGEVPVDGVMDYFPDFESAFKPTYLPMNVSETFYDSYRDEVFDFSVNAVSEDPYNLGSYLFYKMDRENHDYQIMTFFNITSYHSINLFP